MNKMQEKAKKLMCNDLRLLYSIMKNIDYLKGNYCVAFMPYMGIIIDGIEDWINSYNNSTKNKLNFPIFTDEEKLHYEMMRNSAKIFEDGLKNAYKKLKKEYKKSKRYFTKFGVLKKDFVGVYTINDISCDNTILDGYYSPHFSYIDEGYGERLKQLTVIAGKYIVCFDAKYTYNIHLEFIFNNKDFGGKRKLPFGNRYNMSFFLFSLYCQINFIIQGIEELIAEEISSKLRFAYVLYYYIIRILPEINTKLRTEFTLDSKYYSDLFRNAMMHYKLGVALKECELVEDDPMYGLTQKFFNTDYSTLKNGIMNELGKLRMQIKIYLKL